MSPCELHTLITAIANHLYCNLSEKDFNCWSIFLSQLSKQMFTLIALRELCDRDDRLTIAEKIN